MSKVIKYVALFVLVCWSGLTLASSTFDLTAEQFNKKLNSELKETSKALGFKLSKKVNVSRGDVNDVAQINLSETTALVVTLDKGNKKIKSVTAIFASPKGEGALGALLLQAVLIKIFSPEIPADGRGEHISKMLKAAVDHDEKGTHFDAQQARYTMTATQVAGLWFSVEPK
ncbi:hypothetical protein ACQYEX_004186 [Salmonella enterica]|uniref:hypothetical protein n=1 Tax=Salmonella enterica TaxID=28901 RepID=UPI0009B198EC|nr:hypothetical protein [Salmonella enterica]EAB9751612.1 hypothetical protein [Salmonella enterica subsp. salamae]EBW9943019.1 hypothetical protein [Salmonella enterica subsp. enterica serovar Give]EBZ2216948.1 hypothetical protein [Salmonella enterica subsp. enterica serovar Montevideo]ECA5181476.1 hypothetical protein [Salmonella enterica subsp. enterica serovar Newport]ECB3943330.1 hypothetical protein [Salmonella enterica subsp. enterica serovar Stanley]ECD3768498.1 hypothetical protein 